MILMIQFVVLLLLNIGGANLCSLELRNNIEALQETNSKQIESMVRCTMEEEIGDIKQKITKYETFINDRLKMDLQQVLLDRDQVYQDISDYLELRNNIEALQETNSKQIESMVNLGQEFFARAKIPDTSKVVVNVGLDFYFEFSLDEALVFIEQKEQLLNKKAEILTNKSMMIKSQIKMMLHMIHELMEISENN
eukprot:TRINITY_DN9405_c0_g1_i1.p1 TRINITY_DN9405_c0_g1~~TRINITY_DN9405_c0_g1_i1.p1  ORF type:complete len:195 (-),score=34.22 TRINITY_DN9405_c0_g1_i1:16-600(-)